MYWIHVMVLISLLLFTFIFRNSVYLPWRTVEYESLSRNNMLSDKFQTSVSLVEDAVIKSDMFLPRLAMGEFNRHSTKYRRFTSMSSIFQISLYSIPKFIHKHTHIHKFTDECVYVFVCVHIIFRQSVKEQND